MKIKPSTYEPLTPGTLLALQRYRLRTCAQAYPCTDDIQERLWDAEMEASHQAVILHELFLPRMDLALRQRAIQTITDLRGKLAPVLPAVRDFFCEQERLFFVLGALPGQTLPQQLARGVCSEQDVLACCLELCDWLDILAQHQLFHGFLTPECLRQTYTGRWMVSLPTISLLLSRNLLNCSGEWRVALPFPGARRGTPLADLDAIVAIASFGLTGMVLPPDRFPAQHTPGNPAADDIRLFLRKGLQAQEQQRYQTLAELRRDLEALFARRGGLRAHAPAGLRGSASGRLLRSPRTAALSPVPVPPTAEEPHPLASQEPTIARQHADLAMDLEPEEHNGRDMLAAALWIMGSNALFLLLATRGGYG